MFKRIWKSLQRSNEWSDYAKITMVTAKLHDLPSVPEKFKPYCRDILATGSQIICNPKPKWSDVDYMLLVKGSDVDKVETMLAHSGFAPNGSIPKKLAYHPGPTAYFKHSLKEDDIDFNPEGPDKYRIFRSWKEYTPKKRPPLNILVTASREHFENFCKATKLAQQLNLTAKIQRVKLFHAICYDEWDYEWNEPR